MPNSHSRRGGSAKVHLHWAVGTHPMPAFVEDGENPPIRPHMAAVVNGHGQVIGHGVSLADDPREGVEQALKQAIGQPASGFGGGTLPLRVTVDTEALVPLVRRLLPGVPAKVGRSAELARFFEALPSMRPQPEALRIAGQTSYLVGGITPAEVGGFFEACADLYRRKPWTVFAHDQCLFQISSQPLAMNQWCGCVLGQGGESYGVLLFESRRDHRQFLQVAQSGVDHSTLRAGLLPRQRAISFEPLDAISRGLVDEIQRYGWPVAPGDAYPLPMHFDPDLRELPPNREELARLEAMARALTLLIDHTPDLKAFWDGASPEPIRRHDEVPVQARGMVPVSLSLLSPHAGDKAED